jgi:hypothetical protein
MKENLFSKSEILDIVVDALKGKVAERLNTYSSPLNPVIDEVVKAHAETIRDIANACLKETLATKEFKAIVKEEFAHKVAKAMVGKLEGSVEKAVEVLRQNPTLRAQMILSIENIIERNK